MSIEMVRPGEKPIIITESQEIPKTKRKQCIFLCSYNSGCHYNRLILPARFCADKYESEWDFVIAPHLLPEDQPKVLVTYGMPTWNEAQMITRVRNNGGKHIWSLDDDFLNVSKWNPTPAFEENRVDLYKYLLYTADYVTISTDHLLKQLVPRAVCPKTKHDNSVNYYVLPNMIDLENYKVTNHDVKKGLPLQILWVGSPTHRKDLELLVEPMSRIIDKYPNRPSGGIDSLWFGDCDPTLRRKYLNKGLFEFPGCDTHMYHRTLMGFSPHIGLAPLVDDLFNRSRSNLKFLEYAAMGAVPLASPVEPYNNVWPEFEGHLCRSSSDWYNAMEQLIENTALRTQLGREARLLVENRYAWQNPVCRKPWYNFFDTVLGSL